MKTIAENVKNAFKQPTTRRKGRILVNGNYYDVYNVEYYGDCYDDGKVIGNAIASQLDFDIPYMPKFDTFKYFDGIKVGNNYEYIDFGTFTVFDEQDQDEFNKHITAFDNLIKFNKPFVNVGGYPKTLYAELVNVCQQAEVQLINDSIPNGNFIVENNQFVDGESLKTVLKQICSISGNYAICKNNSLKLQLTNPTNEVIDKSQHEPVDWKRRSYGINQVILGNSQIEGEYVIKQDDADIALNGVHKLEILDNLFANTQAKRSALINELYNQVHGFGYIPYETKGEWLSYLEIGDTINIDGIDTILLRINGKSPQALETTMSAPAIIDSSIEYVDNTADVDNRIKLTEIKVDKQNQEIAAVVSQTIDPNNPNSMANTVTRLNIRVGELESAISDIVDITITAEDTDGQVELEGVNESEPIQIKIHPVGENISYDYPHNDYPQNDYSKIRTLKFIRSYTEEGITKTQEIPYELPDDLLYYDSEHYDEFYLDYDNQICQVTKRCKYNADGSVGLLDNEIIKSYPYPTINLDSGNYTVCLVGYANAYLFVRLMAQNIYTTQFYTKAETNSLINQTSSSIGLSVDAKLSNYSTTAEVNASLSLKIGKDDNDQIVSMLNASADIVHLDADRFSWNSTNSSLTTDGKLTVTGGTIGGWSINNNSLHTANNEYYLGTTGINATIGGTSRSNIIFKAGNNFGVNNSGTLYANNAVFSNASISGVINSSTISGTAINGGTINGTSFTGGSININNYFSVNSNGGTQISTSGGGFFTTRTSTHPYVSSLNVAQGSGGIVFRTGTSQSGVGGMKASLELISGVMRTRNSDYYDGYYTCRTGKMSFVGRGPGGDYEHYMAVVNGMIVYVGDNIGNYSELPWLV